METPQTPPMATAITTLAAAMRVIVLERKFSDPAAHARLMKMFEELIKDPDSEGHLALPILQFITGEPLTNEREEQ